MKYVDKVKSASGQNIILMQAHTGLGTDCYYYILADKDKEAELLSISKGMKINLSQYGTIIKKGYGEPSEEVKDFILKEYGTK